MSTYAGGNETTLYVGGLLEKLTTPTRTHWKHLIATPSGQVQVIRRTDGTTDTFYVTTDHLGSTDAVLNAAGTVLMRGSFGVHGARRASNWQGAPSGTEWQAIADSTRRGYTGHEQIDNVMVVHMSGRVFDPAIGRFLSADPYIDGPETTQGWNRYAYVHGHAMSATDPSGFEFMDLEEIFVNGTKQDCGFAALACNVNGYYWLRNQGYFGQPASPFTPGGGAAVPAPTDPAEESSELEEIVVESKKCVSAPFAEFFENNNEPASGVASQYNVDPALLLGLAAAESGYGTSPQARTQNNPFGATPGGFSTAGITYNSYASAWQNWGQQWGRRVENVGSDADLFIANLAVDNQRARGAVDIRGPYNTQNRATGGNPDWARLVAGTVKGVRNRLPMWRDSGC